jgi:hypothetical protein
MLLVSVLPYLLHTSVSIVHRLIIEVHSVNRWLN